MKVRQKWDLSMLNNKIREDFFLLKFQKFWKSAHHTSNKILPTNNILNLNILMQRRYLYTFSVKTVIKVNITLLRSVLLYCVEFSMLYVEQYFATRMMCRFTELLKFQQEKVFTNLIV